MSSSASTRHTDETHWSNAERRLCQINNNTQHHDNSFTPEQLTALSNSLDFSTPKTPLESIDFIENNIGREGNALEACSATPSATTFKFSGTGATAHRSSSRTYQRPHRGADGLHQTAEKDPEGKTWEVDYKLDRSLRIMGTPRLWFCEQLTEHAQAWDDKVKQLVSNLDVMDVSSATPASLQRISDPAKSARRPCASA